MIRAMKQPNHLLVLVFFCFVDRTTKQSFCRIIVEPLDRRSITGHTMGEMSMTERATRQGPSK